VNSSIFSGKRWDLFVVLAWVTLFWGTVQTPAVAQNKIPLAYLSTGEYGVEWYPSEAYPAVTLRVSGPNGQIFEGTFNSTDSPPVFDFYDENGTLRADGVYQYELVAYPILDAETLALLASVSDSPERSEVVNALREAGKLPNEELSQSGNFSFEEGKVLMGNDHALKTVKGSVSDADEPKVTKDVVHNDDVIVGMSLCVGFDCVNGENFGFDTVRLKENNLRLHFNDTSNTGSFPTNDWRIVANDSANGGASYLAIEDSDAGRIPFRVEAGAPAHSLYVDDGGRLGLKTSTPSVEIHSTDGDTPALRLEQNGGSGFQPQTWDLAGNETNLFFRDVTNGSRLPFKIRPNTPTGSLDMTSSTLVINESGNNYDTRIESDNDPNMFFVDASADKIGVGLDTPNQTFQVEKENPGGNTTVWVRNTSDSANSHSRFYASANATAGDPKAVFAIAGGNVWEFGLDNSDGDKFKIARGNDLGVNGYFTITTGGNVGIGNTNPGSLLAVGNGGAVCNGTTWTDGSSRDYKKDIERLSEEDVQGLLAVLDQVDMVSYLYKQEPDTAPERVGVIAEELPEVLASADRKGLELGRNVGFLMGVVKALKAENDKNAEMIAELRAEIEALKAPR
jgi:hypothetical protein